MGTNAYQSASASGWAASTLQHGADSCFIQVDHADPPLCIGLLALLERSGDWQINIAVPNARVPDLVLADYDSALERLRLGQSSVPIMVITGHEREWEIRQALNAGVRGYVLQSCTVEELLQAVNQLLAGKSYLGEILRERIAEGSAKVSLTRRETDVLRLLADGNCNKLIARELDIALGTVKTHVKSLMVKLGANARTQAVVLAAQQGLVSPGELKTQKSSQKRESAYLAPA